MSKISCVILNYNDAPMVEKLLEEILPYSTRIISSRQE